MNREIEILAPAGSYESLKAAVNAGCDAVYIGGNKFGARAFANNLSEEELLQAIDYVHIHGKSLYLTVNTILKNSELEKELYHYIKRYYEQGLDAVIVQDLGVLHFIHTHFKKLPIHASTQMTLTMEKGAKVLEELGVTRIVTSRELNVSEIREIRDNTDLEIESFVHGALCYCYSGQCYMSSMLGGRSGNRGRCAQTCRMPFRVSEQGKTISKEEEKYILSPKDIMTLSMIPDLIEAGIDSFKIEGRMKRPEYTAMVTSIYRKYVDLSQKLGKKKYTEYLSNNKKEYDADIKCLMDLYNRGGFSSGYYNTSNGKSMMAMQRPNHSGVFIGEVSQVKGNRAEILLTEDVNSQDLLDIREKEESLYEFTLKNGAKKGDKIQSNFKSNTPIKKGARVYRTKNDILLNEIKEKYLDIDVKEGIQGTFIARKNEPMVLKLSFKDITIIQNGDVVEEAINQPTKADKIFAQLNKLNTTDFYFTTLDIDADGDIFIPAIKLNELRREAIQKLIYSILSRHRRDISKDYSFEDKKAISEKQDDKYNLGKENHSIKKMDNEFDIDKKDHTKLVIHLDNNNLLDEVLNRKEVDSIYFDTNQIILSDIPMIAEQVQKAQKEFYLVFPHIFRKEAYDSFKLHLEILRNAAITGFVLKNLEAYAFVKEEVHYKEYNKEIILDYNIHTINQEAKNFWYEKEVSHFTSSIELNSKELKELGCEDSDLIVYGHLPLMVSAQCVHKNTKGCIRQMNGIKSGSDIKSTKDFETLSRNLQLTDRKNKDFYVKNVCSYCYNLIYNGQPISLLSNKKEIQSLNPRSIRIDFTFESKEEIRRILEQFIEVFVYNNEMNLEIKDYTRGHFKRGIE